MRNRINWLIKRRKRDTNTGIIPYVNERQGRRPDGMNEIMKVCCLRRRVEIMYDFGNSELGQAALYVRENRECDWNE